MYPVPVLQMDPSISCARADIGFQRQIYDPTVEVYRCTCTCMIIPDCNLMLMYQYINVHDVYHIELNNRDV